MSTFYAAFPDSQTAEQMVRQLLTDGIALDDISGVTRDGKSNGSPIGSVGDASYFVGRADDPTHDLVDERVPGAEYEAAEVSEIGGGISTADRTKNVDSVDQMDESQNMAEDQLYPRENASHASHELDDLNRAVRTGFPTPVTPLDNEVAADTESDRSLEPIVVPGVGVVTGRGDLATAAFDWAGKNGEPDPSSLLTYLQDEGVPPGPANELLAQLGNGGAIMAVTIVPQVNEEALGIAAERNGAVATGSYGAPRY